MLPSHRHFEIVSTHESLTKRAKHQRKVLDQFTRRWKTDYLLSLRENRAVNRTESEPIKIDDVVLLKDDNTPRIFWKFAVVQELIKGKDGHVRSAKVKVLNNSENLFYLQDQLVILYHWKFIAH